MRYFAQYCNDWCRKHFRWNRPQVLENFRWWLGAVRQQPEPMSTKISSTPQYFVTWGQWVNLLQGMLGTRYVRAWCTWCRLHLVTMDTNHIVIKTPVLQNMLSTNISSTPQYFVTWGQWVNLLQGMLGTRYVRAWCTWCRLHLVTMDTNHIVIKTPVLQNMLWDFNWT